LTARWQALQNRVSIFLRKILLVLGETETRIQREEALKQISNAKRSPGS
jgi:hypothetical protein